jgi:predicted HD superfamily hydrolase involved in NAD metabolism
MKREGDISQKTYSAITGIPGDVTLDAARLYVEPRVSKKRLEHIKGVVTVGREIALGLGIDPFPVELGCWLHDACKELKGKELIEIAQSNGLVLSQEELDHGQILHGPVAAILVKKDLRITNEDVLSSIAEHTLGSVRMSKISKIVYLADKLESSRPPEFTDPIWQALNAVPKPGPPDACHDFSQTGEAELDRAMVVALTLIARNLLKKNKPIQPRAMVVRNHFLQLLKNPGS